MCGQGEDPASRSNKSRRKERDMKKAQYKAKEKTSKRAWVRACMLAAVGTSKYGSGERRIQRARKASVGACGTLI